MAMSCVWTVTTLLAWGHPDRPLANTPLPVHRPPDPSITEAGPLTQSTGTLVCLRLTPVVHALGPKPRAWAPRGIHGSARVIPTPATIGTIIQLLFLFFPVADFRLGRRFQNNCPVTPAFGGAALVAELDTRPMFDTRPMISSYNAGLHLDTLHMLHTMDAFELWRVNPVF